MSKTLRQEVQEQIISLNFEQSMYGILDARYYEVENLIVLFKRILDNLPTDDK